MKLKELKAAIEQKKRELEFAYFLNKPHQELKQLYQQLKALQYHLIQTEVEQARQEHGKEIA